MTNQLQGEILFDGWSGDSGEAVKPVPAPGPTRHGCRCVVRGDIATFDLRGRGAGGWWSYVGLGAAESHSRGRFLGWGVLCR
jgi:hypothetical protein